MLTITVPPLSPQLVAWGRFVTRQQNLPRVVYVGEGATSSVAVTERADGVRAFHVAGKVEASTDPQDLRLERMLAHLPALIHPHPRSVLVVGFGAGITAGTFLLYPGIERATGMAAALSPPSMASVRSAKAFSNRGATNFQMRKSSSPKQDSACTLTPTPIVAETPKVSFFVMPRRL